MPKPNHTPHRYRFLMFGRSDHDDLNHQIHYLSVENRILRSKLPKRESLTNKERRRLLRFGKPVGEQIKHLITIVQYATYQRWVRGGDSIRRKRAIKKVGRPPSARHLKELILEIARTPGAWYTRIIGELRKLGIGSISRPTVRSILKEHGIEPAPDRAEPVWDTFIKRHAATLWSCD